MTITSGEDGAAPRNIITRRYFNNRGLLDSESLPYYEGEDPGEISFLRHEYDRRGRVKKITYDYPGTIKDAYSTLAYLSPLETETTDAMGHKKRAVKDVYNNIREIIENGVHHTYYEYDTQNNLIKLTDAQGNITRIRYDSLGRKVFMDDPDMGIWNYDEYDAVSNLIHQTDAKGQTIEFEYDALNRLKKKWELYPQGAVSISVDYQYDAPDKPNCIGRLSKITDASGTTEFFYDKEGRETKTIKTVDNITYIIERYYDILDRLTILIYPDGEVVNYSYDPNSGLLEKVAGSSPYVKDISYNARGQIKRMQYGNDTETVYSYGQDLRLSRILTQNARQAIQNLNYLFDKNGNITTLTDNLRSNIRTYTYDNLDRLTHANNVPDPNGGYTNFNYQYDSIGNMTYKSDIGVMEYGVDAGPHAVTHAGAYSYNYDANGNMTSGANRTMEYDIENRLISVSDLTGTTNFIYDGDGGRVRKGLSPQGTVPEQWTTYIGSLYEVSEGADPVRGLSPSITTKHIFAGSTRICTITTDESEDVAAGFSLRYYHPDHLGSSNVVTDAEGSQTAYYEYTPYGSLSRSEGSDATNYKFTGKELDSTGLYFYGARYYDPAIGRFITADPLIVRPGDPQDLNRYAYCRNNPLNYVDPTGHGWFSKFWDKVERAWDKHIRPVVIAMVIAAAMVFTWGAIAPAMTAMGALFSTAGASAVAAAGATTATLGTGEGRQLVSRVGGEFFDDVLGMRPATAQRWAGVTTYMALNMGFQFGFARMFGANKAITDVKDVNSSNRTTARDVVGEAKGINYGTRPGINAGGELEYAHKLLYSNGEAVGVAAQALPTGSQYQHLGVVMKGLKMHSDMAAFFHQPIKALSQGYFTFGISHQAVNWSLVNAGYNTTIIGIGGGWSTIPSTFVYGPYGGGATGAVANEQIKN